MITMLDTPKQISTYRMNVLLKSIELEKIGMRRHGPSAYSIVKAEFGFKGNRDSVYEQLKKKLTAELEELNKE